MGEVKADKARVVELLVSVNAKRPAADIAMYADAFLEYRTAQANIDAHGVIVLHPRTGAPIDNPYLKVRDRSGAAMRRIKLNTALLWEPSCDSVSDWTPIGGDMEIGADYLGKWWLDSADGELGPFDSRADAEARAASLDEE